MENDIIFRKYREGDEEDLVTLCNNVYGLYTNKDYWRWKYLNNTFNLNASYVATYENRVIGMAGTLPYRLRLKEKEIVGGQLTDLLSHPQLKKKRDIFFPIMRKCIKEIETQMDIMYGFTNDKSFKVYVKRLKYDTAFRIPRLDKIINIKPFIKRIFMKDNFIAKAAGNTINILSVKFSYPTFSSIDKEIKIKEVYGFDERFDHLWNQLKGFFTITTIRDAKYLNWRYCLHPLYKYRILVAEKKEEILGFAILRCAEDKGLKRGYIMDFLVKHGEKKLVSTLLTKSLRFFYDEGVDLVTCWMLPHAPYYKALRRHLFFKRTSDLVTAVTSFNKDISNEFLKNPSNWHVTMGDCDSF